MIEIQQDLFPAPEPSSDRCPHCGVSPRALADAASLAVKVTTLRKRIANYLRYIRDALSDLDREGK
jgi:hypothetical protein